MSIQSDAVAIAKDNRTALIVLIGGTAVFAIVVADHAGNVVESAVDTAGAVARKITTTGFIAAAILIASLLLGAPLFAAFAATGIYLVTSGASTLARGILARSRGTGDGGVSDSELLRQLCKAHGGSVGILEAGGLKLGGCVDGTSFQIKGGT